jgi:hypothetical protein
VEFHSLLYKLYKSRSRLSDMDLELQATAQLSQLFEAHLSTLKAGPLVRQAVPGLRLPAAQHLVPHQLAVEGCDVHYRHRGRAPMSTLQERVLFSAEESFFP